MGKWYVKFDGIDGSASEKMHFGWCNADSVNLGGHKAGGGGTGVGRVGGKMHLEDVSIGIISDRATAKLLEAGVRGKVFRTVVVHGTVPHDKSEFVYLAIELENVQITSYQLGVLDNNHATDDLSLSLNFEKYKTTFRSKEDGSKVEFAWKSEDGAM
jgi:type VI protein secretion system component Hcp